LGFQGHGVTGQGHTPKSMEILWTRWILNDWRNLNQNLNLYLLSSGWHELVRFSGSWG